MFLAEQLKPEWLEAAAAVVGQKVSVRRHPGFDHSYFFISSFMEDHVKFHAKVRTGVVSIKLTHHTAVESIQLTHP